MNLQTGIVLLFVIQATASTWSIFESSTLTCAFGVNYASDDDYDKPKDDWEVEDYVFIYLYTKNVPFGESVYLNDSSIKLSEFNSSRPTKIITHGYLNDLYSDACTLPRDAFLKCCDYNVFVIDWWGVMSWNRQVAVTYNTACERVPIVGTYVAKFINFLEKHGLNLNTTSLIGHSLGAHVMGIAAHKANNTVDKIVGLDPAKPNFELADPPDRLSPEDATTVQVIHSNEGNCGISQPIGHYDFYPNGGRSQPGCWMNACAHKRAVELYTESIANDFKFYGYKCPDLETARKYCAGDMIKMDENLRQQKAQEGIYYFKTNDQSPYAVSSSRIRFLKRIF